MRGNHKQPFSHSGPVRTIPACAGEPIIKHPHHSPDRDYPRVCGGTNDPSAPITYQIGLSPRVRGNPADQPTEFLTLRTIPACAGEPIDDMHADLRYLDYPRVCGGTYTRQIKIESRMGLSPRVRGNPVCPARHSPMSRTIPACAGEPLFKPHPRTIGWDYPRVCGGTDIG